MGEGGRFTDTQMHRQHGDRITLLFKESRIKETNLRKYTYCGLLGHGTPALKVEAVCSIKTLLPV
jgi:hypothetical protein